MTGQSAISPGNAAPAGDRAAHAATMVLLMEDAAASGLLAKLSPDELEMLGGKMCELDEVAPSQIAAAIAAFAEEAGWQGWPSEDRAPRLRAIMEGALGPVRADSMMRRIRPDARPRALEIARWLDPDIMVQLLDGEMTQAIAVILVQLDPEKAAEVLARLPQPRQLDVVHRLATLGPVSPAALEMLDKLIEDRISEGFGSMPLKVGGVREAAELINLAGKAVEANVMPGIGERDKELARQMEEEMFRFEHLFVLDVQQMGQLLREVDSELLIDALKGITEDQRDIFFAAMSSRAADGLRDEIEARGKIKAEEVAAAQRGIIDVAKRLIDDGTLALGAGGDDYV